MHLLLGLVQAFETFAHGRREGTGAARGRGRHVRRALAQVAAGQGQDQRASRRGTVSDEIELTDAPDPAAREVLLKKLIAFNEAKAGPLGWRALAPRLAAWFATLEQRPSFQAIRPVDG